MNKTIKQITHEHNREIQSRLMERMAWDIKQEELNELALADKYSLDELMLADKYVWEDFLSKFNC